MFLEGEDWILFIAFLKENKCITREGGGAQRVRGDDEGGIWMGG